MNEQQAQQPVARLSDFTVEVRPLATERKAKFKPAANWWRNRKLRNAAEQLNDKQHTKYVEDGDLNYKVRLNAS